MNNKKMSKLVTSGMMASALIFSYGIGSAFANEDNTGNTSTEEITETVDLTNEEETTTEVTTTDPTVEEEVPADVEENEESTTSEDVVVEEEPSLVPGDFFYFVKTMAEKIRLAVTFDDYKEAELLAEFAAERIAEANALIADGKTDEAATLLKEAIETQELASETLEQTEESEEASKETEIVEEGTVGTDETTVTEDTEETEVTIDEENGVNKRLGNNIDALLAALAKIDNPKAQQALMKNQKLKRRNKNLKLKPKRINKMAKVKLTRKRTEMEKKIKSKSL
jgi:hypothetical protein